MHRKGLTPPCVALVLFTLVASSGAATLKFTQKADLSGVGLRIRTLSGARDIPLPPPEAFPYRFEFGERSERIEMFDPRELWMADQHAAQWEDPHGNNLLIAIVRRPLPKGFPREHVRLEAYRKKETGIRAPDPWTERDLAQWLSDMIGVRGITGSPIKKPPTRFSSLIKFSFPPEERRIAYAFQLNPAALGQRQATRDYFVASFSLYPRVDMKQADNAIRRKFLSYVSTIPMGQRKSTKTASRQFQAKRQAPTNRKSKAYQQSLDKVTRSIANLKDWWHVETPYYILISNASSKQRRTIKDIQVDLSRLRISFDKLIPPVAPIDAVSVIRIFATDDEFKDYVPPGYRDSDGIWSPMHKELVIRPIDELTGQQQHRRVLETAYHESFHQYLYYALNRADTCVWYNEGHACFFEGADVEKRGITIGEDEDRLRHLHELMKKGEAEVEPVMRMSYEQFYVPDMNERLERYCISWAAVYFLRKGTLIDRRSPYTGLLDAYEKDIVSGVEASRATRNLIDRLDMQQFQKDFEKFWTSSSRRNAAKRARLFKR